MEETLNAKNACATADLTLKNKACGIPENLIISSDKEKIREYILELIKKVAMRGEYYLPLYVYGDKSKREFMSVVDSLNNKEQYSFVIVEYKDETMFVTVTWKESWSKGYKPTIEKLITHVEKTSKT